jgi:hypothetical protein
MKGQILFELCVSNRIEKQIIFLKLYTKLEYAGQDAEDKGFYSDNNLYVKITPVEVER